MANRETPAVICVSSAVEAAHRVTDPKLPEVSSAIQLEKYTGKVRGSWLGSPRSSVRPGPIPV